MPSVYLETLTWIQAERAFETIPLVLVPVGAILKEHGPHLPLNTDYLLARDLARRVAEQTEVIVCPPLTFGYYPAFVHFPGSVNLQSDTFRDLTEQIISSLARNGGQRFVILNTGVSTTAPLTLAANNLVARGIRVALANILDLGKSADSVIENRVGSHANEHETSMLLAIDPGVVKMEHTAPEIRAWMLRKSPVRVVGPLLRTTDGVGEYTPSGVIGDPTRATRERAKRFYMQWQQMSLRSVIPGRVNHSRKGVQAENVPLNVPMQDYLSGKREVEMVLEFAQENLWVALTCWVLIYISDYALTLIGAPDETSDPQHVTVQGSYELNPYFVDDINARRKLSARFIIALAWTTFLLAMIWLLGRTSPFAMRIFELTFGGMILLELAIHMRHFRNIISFRRITQPGEIQGAVQFSRRYIFWVSALDLALYALLYLVMWLFVGNLFFLGGALACGAHALRHRLRMRREPLLPTTAQASAAQASIADGGSAL